ncbi:hypothetical protein MAM1_0311c09526 [Mucor ambiguus]|uniref:Ras-GEF domain-containing protein n=1 Tax=Mucor ambiguus TaxID=91626 RepID=A0A0C9N5X1_9FUNG|nr:hypothetical protein MAM1_0311c09526 [Mucor ambiguus]
MRLPLIPLSPYVQTLREYAQVLALTAKSLSEQQDNANIKSSLEKSLNKEREKLDRLTKSMQSIQSSCLLDFNIYDIAKEIAYINCSLFRLVTLDPTWLCNFDKQSNMVPLLDFHRYLSHSFAHQVVYGDPKKKSVIQLIHLAYILLHVYRDFSGCTAILTSLHMPEVRRLESMWASCPARLMQVYQDLVVMLLPDNNYEAYHHQLWLHTHRFLDMIPSKSQMIAVPFMHAHLAIIQNLVQTHASVQAAPDVVLSSAGQPLLASTVQLLEFCQQFNKMDPADLEQYAVVTNKRASIQSSSSSNKRASTSNSKAIKLSSSACLDLDILRSDANVYHWIVSRAYLTRSQLYAESLHVEPLAVGEIELEPEEEHDLYWDFFDKQESVVVVNKEPPPVKSSPRLKHTDSNKQPQQQQDLEQATVDGLDVVDSVGTPSLSLSPAVDTEHVSLGEQDADEPSTDGIKAASNHDMITSKKEEEEEEDGIPSVDHVVLEGQNANEMDSPSMEQPAEASNKSVSEEIVIRDQQSSKETIQPMMEKEEPMSAHMDEVEPVLLEHTPFPVTTTLAYDDGNDDDDDDIIILTEEDDEEWTGYPFDSTPSQTVQDTEEEDEEWTGYPITSQDEHDMAEEDEEVWKGYPVPSSEDDELQPQQQQPQDGDEEEERKSPVDLSSSPATPSEEGNELIHRHEEWKGYQKTAEEELQQQQQREVSEDSQEQQEDDPSRHANPAKHHHQLHAIGKAAARRMQYSLSSTDTNRKRLPSPFAPSSST